MKYALIQDGAVTNIVLWDGEEGEAAEGQTDWKPFSEIAWPDSEPVPLAGSDADVEIGDAYNAVTGGFTKPVAPPQPREVPVSITNAQAKLHLLDLGKLADVTAAIDGLPDDVRERAQIEWANRPTFERQSATVAMLALVLGFSEAQLDDMFVAAALL